MSKKPEIPFEAYDGEEPYIFVSYAHDDSTRVYPDIEKWHQAEHRIWYDEGIGLTSEWPDQIERKLRQASFFVVFISKKAVASENVRNEINLAVNQKLPILAIHLEKTELRKGLGLQIGSKQGVMKYDLTAAEYVKTINQALQEHFSGKAIELVTQGKGGFLIKMFLLIAVLLITGSATVIIFPELLKFNRVKLDENSQTHLPNVPEKSNNQPEDTSKTSEEIREPIQKPPIEDGEARKRKILLNDISEAKDELNKAIKDVPGSKSDWNKDENYQQALAKKDTGETSDNLPEALRSFKQATRLFVKSQLSIFISKADEAETAMQEARKMAEPDGKNEKAFQQALEAEIAGKQAYNQQNYATASERYQKAAGLYTRASMDVMTRRQAVEKAIENILSQYKRSLEKEDTAGLRALYKNYTDVEEKHWSNVFKLFKIQRVVLAPSKKEIISSSSAVIDVLIRIFYKNNRGEDTQLNRQYEWTLEQIDEKWVIARFAISK